MKNKNIIELNRLLINFKLSPLDLCKYFLKRVENNFDFNCFTFLDYKRIFFQINFSNKLIKNNSFNLLTGIPFYCKDNFLAKNFLCSSGSKLLKNFFSPYNATLIKKLKNLGSIILAKNNMDEFSVGFNNLNYNYGVVKNSLNKFISSGGSSGGSAASISLKLAPFSIGSDTGGSLREPGELNSIITLKPTYGRISRYGMISYSSSLDHPGIMCNNILDCALVLNSISGLDIKDSTSLFLKKEDYTRYIGKNWLKNFKFNKFYGLIIGISKNFFFNDLDYDIRCNFEYILSQFEFLGAKITYLCFSFLNFIDSLYYLISSVELSSNLSRFDGIIYGYNKFLKLYNSIEKFRSFCFNDKIKDKIIIGNYIISSKLGRKFFLNSKKIRKFLLDDFQIKFNFCDVIITPVLPIKPWYIFNKFNNFYSKIFIDFYNTFVNFLGLPSLTIPSGIIFKYNLYFSLSFQIVSNYCKEARIIQLGYEFQNLNNFLFNSLWV